MLLERHGLELSTADVARAWLQLLPAGSLNQLKFSFLGIFLDAFLTPLSEIKYLDYNINNNCNRKESYMQVVDKKTAKKADGEAAVLAAITAMPAPYRAMGERLHAIIKASAPALSPRVWYGMPAYAKDGKVVCFFRGGEKFKERYMTLGFNDEANLDEGHLWPIAFALKELTAAEEARIGSLVKKAVS